MKESQYVGAIIHTQRGILQKPLIIRELRLSNYD